MIKKLPLTHQIETQKVLKKAISGNRALANLNRVIRIIPNSAILIIQEVKVQLFIENIIISR